MTVDPARLLQMLEPTVRPGSPSSAGGAQQAKPAFEDRSFDDLLHEAKAGVKDGSVSQAASLDQADPLGPLGGLVQVENAGLRAVLARAYGSEQV